MKNDQKIIYFDHQSTTPVDERVLEKMLRIWHGTTGNPHASEHSYGWAAQKEVARAQFQVAELVGGDASGVVFTSGATESNNLAILGIAEKHQQGDRKRILVSSTEHKCVLAAARSAQERFGYQIEMIPVFADGRLNLDWLAGHMDQDVLLVSVMAVNNEVGSINDIAAVAEHVKPHGAFYHVDAAQAPVAMDTSDFALDADLISLSAHKMYGPQGIGALYVGHDMHEALVPQIYGGGQQTGLRSGTVPVALVAGMAEAARLVMEEGEDIRRHLSVLKERLWAGIQNNIPDAVLNGARFDIRHPGNLNIQIPSVVAQDLVLALQPGLACSTGSACTSGIQEPSHVLRAMGLSSVEAGASLRLSVGRSNACEDVDRAVEYIVGTIEKIRSSDPVADIA